MLFFVAVEWPECFEWLCLAMGYLQARIDHSDKSINSVGRERERERALQAACTLSKREHIDATHKLPFHVTQLIQILQLCSNFHTGLS